MPLPRWQPETPIRLTNTGGGKTELIATPTDTNYSIVIDRIDVLNDSATNCRVDFGFAATPGDFTTVRKSLTNPKDYGGNNWFGEWKIPAGSRPQFQVVGAVTTAYISVDYHLERL